MAKRKKPHIDWNGLTPAEIRDVIQHFADAEAYYRTQMAEQHHGAAIWSSALPVVQSRRKFWTEMLPMAERGEKLSTHVRDYLTYCRHTQEF